MNKQTIDDFAMVGLVIILGVMINFCLFALVGSYLPEMYVC